MSSTIQYDKSVNEWETREVVRLMILKEQNKNLEKLTTFEMVKLWPQITHTNCGSILA